MTGRPHRARVATSARLPNHHNGPLQGERMETYDHLRLRLLRLGHSCPNPDYKQLTPIVAALLKLILTFGLSMGI
jgi:hypothetical protein